MGPSEIEGERCRFDNDDAAELSDPLDLSAFSVSLWVKADNWGDGGSSDYHALFYRLAGDSLYPRASLKADGRIKLQLRTNGVTQAVTTSRADAISDLNWHHLAFTFDDVTGVGTLSLDGELVLSHTFQPGALDSGNHTAKLGRNDNQNISLQGRLDEVRIYDRVLTPHEIRILSGP